MTPRRRGTGHLSGAMRWRRLARQTPEARQARGGPGVPRAGTAGASPVSWDAAMESTRTRDRRLELDKPGAPSRADVEQRRGLLGGLNTLPLLHRVPSDASASDTIPAGEDNK